MFMVLDSKFAIECCEDLILILVSHRFFWRIPMAQVSMRPGFGKRILNMYVPHPIQPCRRSQSFESNIPQVHAYPNVGYESIQLPTTVSNIDSFHLSGSWSVFPVADPTASDMTTALNAIACKADIALDIFLDMNNVSSTNASAASHEVMVWQSVWGGVWPIGYYDPPTGAPEYNLSGVTYQLFTGRNQQGQKQAVFSWVPTVYQESIDADVHELVKELVRIGNITDDMYLGLIQFGSETVHASEPVELQMKDIEMSIGVSSSRTASPTATSTSKGGAERFQAQITNFAVPAALGLGVMLGI